MSDSSDLAENAEELLELIQNAPVDKVTAANKLDIAPTTVKDHISSLRDAGHEITYNRYAGRYEYGDVESYRTVDDIDYDEVSSFLQKGGGTEADIADEFDTTEGNVRDVLHRMRETGYVIDSKQVDGDADYYYVPEDGGETAYRLGDGDDHYEFAVISDTHLGSQVSHVEELHAFYDRCVERGIDEVFHCGDISDGWKVHNGQINVLEGGAVGWENLQDYVVENYPQRDGITTYFIEGNHDRKLYRRTGVRFGEQVAAERDDLKYCGDCEATFVFDEENDITMELIHPSGGKPYTAGYRLQTLYREREAGNRPTIAIVGHMHGSMYAETEGVKGLYAGAWKGVTTYGKRKGHEAKIGGWIIDMDIKDGRVTQFVPQWQGWENRYTGDAVNVEDIRD